MDYIKYETTLKASGREYSKIVFWNRFIRNPIELILTWLPAAITIVCIALGCFSSYLAVIYAACWCYPIYIFGFQFKSSVNYHLKNRDASESAPCTITLMESGILAEIPEFKLTYNYSWDDFTTIYDKFGYYMFFEKGKMTVMLRQADMPEQERHAAADFIKKNVNQNICRVLF
jgi:hypothetical protein